MASDGDQATRIKERVVSEVQFESDGHVVGL